MVVMQSILLKIGLDHRPAPYSKGGEAAVPFARVHETQRPFNFWQWRSPKPWVTRWEDNTRAREGRANTSSRYWQFLLSFVIGLVVCELLLAPVPGVYQTYSSAIGIIGLSVEATLPIPQILANARSRSCKGFRLSVLASWLIGDSMKIFWFFTSPTSIPLAFKVCGCFQAACDSFLGVQYLMYGDGEPASKAHELSSLSDELKKPNGFSTASGHAHTHVHTAGRRTSMTERKL